MGAKVVGPSSLWKKGTCTELWMRHSHTPRSNAPSAFKRPTCQTGLCRHVFVRI